MIMQQNHQLKIFLDFLNYISAYVSLVRVIEKVGGCIMTCNAIIIPYVWPTSLHMRTTVLTGL
jgi:hypothetical protein